MSAKGPRGRRWAWENHTHTGGGSAEDYPQFVSLRWHSGDYWVLDAKSPVTDLFPSGEYDSANGVLIYGFDLGSIMYVGAAWVSGAAGSLEAHDGYGSSIGVASDGANPFYYGGGMLYVHPTGTMSSMDRVTVYAYKPASVG